MYVGIGNSYGDETNTNTNGIPFTLSRKKFAQIIKEVNKFLKKIEI